MADEAPRASGVPPAWIRIPEDHQPDGDNVLRVHALHPAGGDAHLRLYRAVMASTPGLSKVDRELVALEVSRANGCHH